MLGQRQRVHRRDQQARPTGVKGTYIKKATLSSTMGPGVKLDVAGFGGAHRRRRPSTRFRRRPARARRPVAAGADSARAAASVLSETAGATGRLRRGGLIAGSLHRQRRNRTALSSAREAALARLELLGQVRAGLAGPGCRDRTGPWCNRSGSRPQGEDQRTQTWRRSVDRSHKEKLVASLNDPQGGRSWSS